MKTERLNWVDGLRGLACILIFTHHFLISFFPSTYTGDLDKVRMIYGLDAKLATSPLSVVICGNYWVSIFCTVSGLVLAYQIYKAKTCDDIGSALIKRYPRLCFPLVAASLVTWIMMQFSMFPCKEVSELSTSSWIISSYMSKMSFKQFINSAFVTTWLTSDTSLSPAYWLMATFLRCSFLCYFLALITKNRKKTASLIFILAIIYYLYMDSILDLAFVLGSALAYRIIYFERNKFTTYFGVAFILCGLYFGGYPSQAYPQGSYLWFGVNISQHFVPVWQTFHVLGAILLVWGIYCVKPVANFLSTKIFQFLGKISYAVFLIHCPIIFSWSCFSFLLLYHKIGRYELSVLFSFVTSTVLLLALSYLFQKYVETNITKLINWMDNSMRKIDKNKVEKKLNTNETKFDNCKIKDVI